MPSLSLAVLGGQGTYVFMDTANVQYNVGTDIFSADITVQNLIAQPLGTNDGTTVTGINVFHHTGPTGNTVVNNADGTQTFTAANQPFFNYNQILQTNDVSAAKSWEWDLNADAGFTFQVLVSADIPDEQSVLLWSAQNSNTLEDLNGIWGASATDYFAVGDMGTILHTTDAGVNWNAQTSNVTGQSQRRVGKLRDRRLRRWCEREDPAHDGRWTQLEFADGRFSRSFWRVGNGHDGCFCLGYRGHYSAYVEWYELVVTDQQHIS